MSKAGEAGRFRVRVPVEPWNARERAVFSGKSESHTTSSTYETRAVYPSVPTCSTLWYASRRWRVPREERSLRERENFIPSTAEALGDAFEANLSR